MKVPAAAKTATLHATRSPHRLLPVDGMRVLVDSQGRQVSSSFHVTQLDAVVRVGRHDNILRDGVKLHISATASSIRQTGEGQSIRRS